MRSALQRSGDGEAIELWLATRAEGSAHTVRAYAREAMRFALWLSLERGKSFCDATLRDCLDFRTFMADPVPAERWCGPRGPAVGSAEWRPFEGPLSVGARRQAVVILTGLFRFLQDQCLVKANPWAAVKTPKHASPRVDPGRCLTSSQWAVVREAARRESLFVGEHDARQLQWLLQFLYGTGLRRSEMTNARIGDLCWVEPEGSSAGGAASEAAGGGWAVHVLGKGQRQRTVPVPDDLVNELTDLIALRGLRGGMEANRKQPMLVAWASVVAGNDVPSDTELSAMSDRGLSRKLDQVFAEAARMLDGLGRLQDAEALRRATVHWLRHTHATHAVAAEVPLDVVQQNLGHASLATTTIYVQASMSRRLDEMSRLGRSGGWGPGFQRTREPWAVSAALSGD